MAAPSYTRSLVCAVKRLRISPPSTTCAPRSHRHVSHQPLPADIQNELSQLRLPRAVQSTYLAPLKRQPTTQEPTPTCDLQLRSYSVRNLEIFTDFALRAAYYLGIPASGPVPLPKITERWTVPRSNFIFKKSQENFERITLRRLIQIQDGDPSVVAVWLSFLRKYQYFGVGLKANVFEHSDLNVSEDLEKEAERIRSTIGESLSLVGRREGIKHSGNKMKKMLMEQLFRAQWGAYGAMGGAASVPPAKGRIGVKKVDSSADGISRR